jgi:ferredoxin
MADRLKRIGKDYTIHYAGRTRARMAFLPRLTRDHGDRLHLHVSDEGTRLDVRAVIGPSDVQVYACGPHRLLADLEADMADRRPLLHVELFSARGPLLDPEKEQPFVAELRDSGVLVAVSADQTLLQALRANGIDVPSDCEEGLCGSCEVGVLAGTVDHRDAVLSAVERTEHSRMMVCCSRARGSSLLLAL